ncbi:unnamed protein product [Cunninghamella echinulata]
MARASATKRYAKKRARESGGRFISKNQQPVIEEEKELINFEYDDELIMEEEIDEVLINVNPKFETFFLSVWTKDVGSQLREGREKYVEQQQSEVVSQHDEMKAILNNLSAIIKDFTRGSSTTNNTLVIRYQACYIYYQKLIDGLGKLDASCEAASCIYHINNDISDTNKAKSIRKWAEGFIKNGYIQGSLQGNHTKQISILSDETVKLECIKWLKEIPVAKRSP